MQPDSGVRRNEWARKCRVAPEVEEGKEGESRGAATNFDTRMTLRDCLRPGSDPPGSDNMTWVQTSQATEDEELAIGNRGNKSMHSVQGQGVDSGPDFESVNHRPGPGGIAPESN